MEIDLGIYIIERNNYLLLGNNTMQVYVFDRNL